MGIPMLAKTICRKYPSIIDHNKQRCSRLYLDLNCAIHTCTNHILSMNNTILPETLEQSIVHHTIEYINKIVNFTRPEDLLFIAIDGIPPRAKMAQQRKRRYVSSWRNNIINRKRRDCHKTYTEWDTNAITPGTPFMNFLAKSLHDHFDNPHKHGLPVQVILSDSNEPGEGEAKILDHIKATDVPVAKDIIYGLDADLIMLALLSSKNNILLLREPAHYNMKVSNPFLYFNIMELRKYISIECNYTGSAEFDENVVWDYVALCFILGNDFLPPLSFLKIKFNGIDVVVDTYKKTREQTQLTFVVKDQSGFHLNYMFLLKFLEHLKNDEDANICEAEQNYYNHTTVQYMGKKCPVERLSMEIDNHPTLHKFPRVVQPEKTGWRLNYYNYIFNITDITDINEVCLNYLEGVEWTFKYYFDRCSSQDWYFKYEHSPTILDMYNFLLVNMTDTEKLLKDSIKSNYPAIAYDTDLQLLLVLPPASKQLIKPHLRCIMDDLSLGCSHYYPSTFMITSYLKTYLWECAPILPLIDAQTVQMAQQACALSSMKV